MVETSNGDGRNYEGTLRKWASHEENMEYLKNMIDQYYQDSPGKRRSHEETMEYIKNMIGRLENHERKPQN